MSRHYFRYFFFITMFLFLAGCTAEKTSWGNEVPQIINIEESWKFSLASVPGYTGDPYVVLNDNRPSFSDDDLVSTPYEKYSELDELGRCGPASANICKEVMPTEDREPIGDIKPSGWHTVKYNDLIDGNYLYNRCHLIGYQLSGENANERNLITGTRYLNTIGMLPFENMVAEYIEETGNHVVYKVTPVFEGDDLLAHGVIMEAESVEDHGSGITFNVYVYNVQPGIVIDYHTGESSVDESYTPPDQSDADKTDELEQGTYILNKNTHKFHLPTCGSVYDMKGKNKIVSNDSREQIIEQGYEPCKRCNP